MAKKIVNVLGQKSEGYNWKYCSLGGVTRVNIASGDDIAHLDELDQKLWTVLSCPTKGLEFDEKTLALLDVDGDGKIKVPEIVKASKWLTTVLKDSNLLLRSADSISLEDINSDTEEGATLLAAMKTVLANLNKTESKITFSDLTESQAAFTERCKTEREAKIAAAGVDNRPYGDNTDTAIATVDTLKTKVADFFMRCKLIEFNENCAPTLDVSVEKIGAISAGDLSASTAEIATYPLARPNKKALLPIAEGLNPAWQSTMATLKTMVIDADFPKKDEITEEDWKSIVDKIETYKAAKAAQATEGNDLLDAEDAAEQNAISLVDKFLHFYRDFYKLLRNYVMFIDFYSRNEKQLAIFQAGKLFIDQRCCDLCVRVDDMSKHADMAGLSGMYLIYCTCTSKSKAQTMNIVAVLTEGDVSGLREGKNAVFYDRNGDDWDAVVTKIVDNPISIKQAFWSPYRKFWIWCTEKLNKIAEEKESKSMENLTTSAETATTEASAKIQAGEKSNTAQAFDIAKFAGIFAAIGMALGMIGSAIAACAKGFLGLTWWQMPLVILGILLLISGPSMLIAWTKLRKRDLGPVLNANGWAINARVVVNTRFGATLTSMAKYPKLDLVDPFKEKEMPAWKKWLISISVVVVAVLAILLFMKMFNSESNTNIVANDSVSVVQTTVDSTAVVE